MRHSSRLSFEECRQSEMSRTKWSTHISARLRNDKGYTCVSPSATSWPNRYASLAAVGGAGVQLIGVTHTHRQTLVPHARECFNVEHGFTLRVSVVVGRPL